MKQNKRKILAYFIAFIALASFVGNIVKAEDEVPHVFGFYAYDYDPITEEGTEDEYQNEGTVEPGKVIALDVTYEVGSDTKTGVSIGLIYDDTVLDPILDPDEGTIYYDTYPENTNLGGIWPPTGTGKQTKLQTPWNYSSLGQVGNKLNLVVTDSSGTHPLETSGNIATFYFKVKEDARAGTTFKFQYDPDSTMLSYSPATEREELELTVYGEASSDATLDTLVVKNGATEYTLDPAFTSGTTTKTFETVVPNNVSSIDIEATAKDSTASVTAGTGSHSLSVGNNSFDVAVTAGDETTVETYQVKVYRLSNTATLSNLSLSSVDIGEFKSETTSYTALVPYSTSSTTITATKSDSKATVVIDGGNVWSLTNTGATTNDKDIVVNAENCDSKYSTVPGNTCTFKKYSVSITRTAASTNANLATLTVDGTALSGLPNTTEFVLEDVANNKTSINIQATVADINKATITTTLGNKNLSIGDNSIPITVKAEDGVTTKTYTIKVRRLNNDNKLASLTVTSNPAGSISPSFNPSVFDFYTYTAPADATEVTISGTLSDSTNATILTDLSQPFNIVDNPVVNVTVQAEDGTQGIYVIKLVRSKSTNNNLASLGVDGYTISPAFAAGTPNYTLTVPASVSSVNVTATLDDSRASIVSGTGNQDLTYGDNNIEVKVKAEDNSTNSYFIKITREKKNIATLSDLKVDGVTVTGFASDTPEYTLPSVAFEKSTIKIEATATDSDATISGTGDSIALSTGDNKLYVTVTAHDGITQTSYILNIERAQDSNAYLSDLKVNGVTIDGFNKETPTYSLTVENNVTSLTITPTTESTAATAVVSGNSGFVTTGNNAIDILVTAEDGTTNTYTINVTRKKSSNCDLSGIGLSSGALDPAFNADKINYTVNVSRTVENITITPTLADSTASYTISGPSSLELGDNVFEINVTAEDGTSTKKYTVVVNRNKSSNAYLSDLKVDGSTVTGFNRETPSYTVNVATDATKITIAATAEDSLASITGDGEITLTDATAYDVIVTAEDGTTSLTYTININRLQSSNSLLQGLSIAQTGISPAFDPTKTEYTASVDYSVTSIDIIATAADSKATVTGAGTNISLPTGTTRFTIKVIAEDTSFTEYFIDVTRAKNNNALLSNITVSEGTLDPKFDAATTSYTVEVDNDVKSITVTGYLQDSAATLTGNDTYTLDPGDNPIDLIVLAENGTTTETYTIVVKRARSADATLKSLTVSSGTLDPIFAPGDKEYAITVDNEIENVTITAEPNSDEASVSISGNNNLPVGTQRATITVTAGDGSIDYYYIDITRNPSSNNFLSALSVTDVNGTEYISFTDNTVTSYNVTVENDIDKVTISATADDLTSTVEGTGEKTNLPVGEVTEFDVIVTSAANIPRTYKIKVYRKPNSNSNLGSLTVSKGTYTPSFAVDKYNYEMTLDSDDTELTITATPEVASSSAIITQTSMTGAEPVSGTGTFTLAAGANTFQITVNAADATSSTYTLTVNRPASTNATLTSLSVSEGDLDPEFSPNHTKYTVSVPNTTDLITITAVGAAGTKVTGDGIKSLSVGKQTFDIIVTAEDGTTTENYFIDITRDGSSNNKLSDLTIDGTTIEGFSPDGDQYTINVPNDKDTVEIGGSVADPTAEITAGLGSHTLSTGNNVIDVQVTAENGDVNTYQITINRAKNSNAYLKTLVVAEDDLSPEFNKETTTYSVTVPNEVSSLNITATPEVTTSGVTILNNNSFTVGSNTVTVRVTAEDGTSKRDYEINVTRQPYADNFLSSLTVKGSDDVDYTLSPEFNKNTLAYEVAIPSSLSSVNIAATLEDSSATITGDGNVPISSLPQTQKVKVTKDGITRTYRIKFIPGLSGDNKLLSLGVNPGTLTPAFNKNTDRYKVTLPEGTTSINVSATANNSDAVVIGTGSHTLTAGKNNIEVSVTAANGSVNTYSIEVTVSNGETENKLDTLTVSEGTLTPAFDPDTNLYEVTVDSTTSTISIDATGSNTITGLGEKTLSEGNNIFEVKSIDDNGNANTYRIVVTKPLSDPTAIMAPELAYLAIDKYDISPSFDPSMTSYSATLAGESAATVVAYAKNPADTVVVTGNDDLNNNNNITITVTNTNGDSKIYSISVSTFLNKLKTNVYPLDNTYVDKVPAFRSVGDIKNDFVNPNEYLKVYDADGALLSDDAVVGTNYKISLEKDGVEHDYKYFIVIKDVNGDADVSISDIVLVRRHILNNIVLSEAQLRAGMVNDDTEVDVSDLILIRRTILERE